MVAPATRACDASARQAAARGDSRMVRALIQMGADVNEVDERGRCALHCCVKRGHLGVLGVLIKLGADVNRQAHGQAEETALHVAARGRFSASVGLLLQVYYMCVCALHLGHVPRAERMLTAARSWGQHGAHVNIRTSFGETPLHIAATGVCFPLSLVACLPSGCVHMRACSAGRLKAPRQTKQRAICASSSSS